MTFSRDNPRLMPLVDPLRLVRDPDHETQTAFPLQLANLMPDTNLFFQYHGSLTTPPCAESVQWIIFPFTNYIGRAQVGPGPGS